MFDRLSALDVSFLYLEGPSTPMHVGSLAVFDRPEAGFDFERFVDLVQSRIGLVPRYRQKIKWVPGHIANPVWVDDQDFNVNFHVRRSALPRPGTDVQLYELVARLQSRPLDRSRPLWEMNIVEGLAGNRFALITKTHHAMVDGVNAIDITQVILDSSPTPSDITNPRVTNSDITHRDITHPDNTHPDITHRDITHPHITNPSVANPGVANPDGFNPDVTNPDGFNPDVTNARWTPRGEPGTVQLVADALLDLVHRPTSLLDTVRMGVNDTRSNVGKITRTAVGLLAAAQVAVKAAPTMPLNTTIGSQRRFAVARTSLDDYRTVRTHFHSTVNDVVLATVAGALRAWLLSRGRPVRPSTTVRAMVPLSVRSGRQRSAGNLVSSFLVDLPVGEPNPLVRLTQISYAMTAHKESGQAVGAEALIALSGFAPPTLHALGARAANSFTRRLFNLVVTNVPGPQIPMYVAGARMREIFPILPLGEGQGLSIGLTSYDGDVYFGLNADWDSMADVAVLASLIEESLAELVTAVPVPTPASRPRRRRGK